MCFRLAVVKDCLPVLGVHVHLCIHRLHVSAGVLISPMSPPFLLYKMLSPCLEWPREVVLWIWGEVRDPLKGP